MSIACMERFVTPNSDVTCIPDRPYKISTMRITCMVNGLPQLLEPNHYLYFTTLESCFLNCSEVRNTEILCSVFSDTFIYPVHTQMLFISFHFICLFKPSSWRKVSILQLAFFDFRRKHVAFRPSECRRPVVEALRLYAWAVCKRDHWLW